MPYNKLLINFDRSVFTVKYQTLALLYSLLSRDVTSVLSVQIVVKGK